jgi:hypothetical protein
MYLPIIHARINGFISQYWIANLTYKNHVFMILFMQNIIMI